MTPTFPFLINVVYECPLKPLLPPIKTQYKPQRSTDYIRAWDQKVIIKVHFPLKNALQNHLSKKIAKSAIEC